MAHGHPHGRSQDTDTRRTPTAHEHLRPPRSRFGAPCARGRQSPALRSGVRGGSRVRPTGRTSPSHRPAPLGPGPSGLTRELPWGWGGSEGRRWGELSTSGCGRRCHPPSLPFLAPGWHRDTRRHRAFPRGAVPGLRSLCHPGWPRLLLRCDGDRCPQPLMRPVGQRLPLINRH